MKDLLKVSGDLVIVGLHDRAFVGSLRASSTHGDDHGGDDGDGDNEDDLSSARPQQWVELAPTPFEPTTSTATATATKKQNKLEEELVEVAVAVPNPDQLQQSMEKCNPVQAVALFGGSADSDDEETVFWCAVARFDKSLAVYRVDRSIFTTATGVVTATVTEVPVLVAHHTHKRTSDMCFATVPPPLPSSTVSSSVSSSSSSVSPLLVVIAADLAGDATAFSTQNSSSPQVAEDSAVSTSGEDDPMMLGTTLAHRRVLLGHTASMLTSVAVVVVSEQGRGQQQQQPAQSRILTADRDEKIRVSSFPNTHIVEGYLLGHTAYVAGLDTVVIADTADAEHHRCWCVSFGGDDTLRLWDCHTRKQLAVACTYSADDTVDVDAADVDGDGDAAPEEADAKNAVNKASSSESDDNQNDEAETKNENDKPITRKPVPSKVTINDRGDRIATICDESHKIFIWKVVVTVENTGQNTFEILPCHHFRCPRQPLALSFHGSDQLLVLLRDPDYLEVYHIQSSNSSATVPTTTTSYQTLCRKLRRIVVAAAAPVPIMPISVLERDAFGNLKMEKSNEQRGNNAMLPWNNVQRKATAKERQKRVRKRKHEGKQKTQG